MGLSIKGQLQKITLPVRTEVDCIFKNLPSAIGDVCERYTVRNVTVFCAKIKLRFLFYTMIF